MAFSEEDKIVIEFLRKNKHYGAKQLILLKIFRTEVGH